MADRNESYAELQSTLRRSGFARKAQQALGFVAALMLLGAGAAHAGPDLATVDVDASAVTTDSQTLVVGGNLQVSIQNIGDADVVAPFDVLAFEDLNGDGEFDGGDQVLGTTSYAAGLVAAASTGVTVAVSGTVQFAGNLIYALADSGNAIAEDDETNNLRNTGQGSIFIPPVGAFDPVVKYQALRGLSIISTPMVVNLTDDNGDGQINDADIPDMVFATLPVAQFSGGPIVAVSGEDGSQLFEAECPPRFGANNRCIATLSELGVGDIDGDGLPEIIGANVNGNALVAVEHDGSFKWESDFDVLPGRSDSGGAISIANLDGFGLPEIIVGASVYDAAGTLLGDGRDLGGTTAFKLFTAISAVADVDLDGTPEVIAGPTAYRFEGGVLIKEWQRQDRLDGFIGIANFDDDDFAEIVVVQSGGVYMLNHDGTNAEVWNPAAGNAPVTLPGGGAGGPPTIADYDGDGENEIGIAGASRYVVFEADGTVKWTSVTQDFSSQTTGSTPFDFDGDGSVEVVYRDEQFLRIYRGTDGFILFERPMRSATGSELPVVADIDNDGRAEIAVCSDPRFGGTLDDTGIYVFEDANDTWVNTRPIWNQHSYHITNVNLDGTIPTVEQNNWQVPGLNNFRQNLPLPDEGTALDAPDLVPSFIRFDQQNCPDFVTLTARVGNGGSLLAPTGLNVSFYDGPPGAGGTLIGTTQTSFNLEPGQFEDVSVQWNAPPVGNADVYVVADDDGAGNGAINEGDESNNTASASEVLCSPVCIDNLAARPKPGKIQLTWTHVPGATYDVLRSGAVGGPFTQIASTDSTYSTYLDQPVDNGVPYYYQIRRMPGNLGENSCLSDVVGAVAPEGRRDRLTTVPDIREQPQAAAEAALAAANLDVGVVSLVASDTVPAGNVVDQDPPPNSVVPRGYDVAFSVSTGAGGPTNTLPIVDAGGDVSITEGDALIRAGSFVDPDADTWMATVDYGDGGGAEGLFLTPAKTFELNHTYVDDGVFTVTVTVNDGTGPGSSSFTVTVANAAPVVEAGADRTITAGDATSLDPASFTDAGIADTHTATIDWGDGTGEAGVVTQGAGSGTVDGSHVYAVASDYLVTVTVTDNAGASGSDTFTVSVNPVQVSVPDVVGLSQAAAEAAIVGANLTVGAVTTANSATVPAGDVISQDPAAGILVDESSPVSLVVSLGPPDTVVPDVVGLSQAAAEAAIVAANLTVGTVSTANSATVPAGDVISQDPAGGSTASEGSAVDLVVSLGPVQVTVPDVVGLSQGAAEADIVAANLTVGNVSTAVSAAVPAGNVISQNPLAGTQASPGAAVDLVVSLGPILVPNVVGLQQAVAEADIVAAGLRVGSVTIQVSATEPDGTVLSQDPVAGSPVDEQAVVNLVVAGADIVAPTVSIDLDPPVADPDQSVLVTITAADESGVAPTVSATLDGSPLALDASNQATFSSPTPGSFLVVATATDGSGNSAQASETIQVRDPADTTPPVVALNAPADLTEITVPTDLIGTASDANLARYQLGLRRDSSNTFTIFAEGTSEVVNGVLAEFDPTLLENGIYHVRLVAEDLNGLTAIAERTYVVEGEAKVGVMQLSFIDLSIPVAGVPISVLRSYDSRIKTKEAFGVGWTLDIFRGTFENNRLPGQGWQILPSGGFISLPCMRVSETLDHLTEIRLSDREAYKFRLTLQSPFVLGGGCGGEAAFEFVDGTLPGATLTILSGIDVLYQGGNEVVDFDPSSPTFLMTYDPKRVRLTTVDGRVVDIDRNAGGVTRIADSNGNSATIGPGGVVHSSGASIVFDRDLESRITRIVDPEGNELLYGYDAAGDLTSFTDQEGNVTTFEYGGNHNLVTLDDPLGNRALSNEFDADGRLIATVDANGNRIELTHDLAANREVVVDGLGNPTVLAYDDRGNVVSEERSVTIEGVPVLAVSARQYDADDNETQTIDPDGVVTLRVFDAGGNVLQEIANPGGANLVTAFTYNARGQILSRTEPDGNVALYTYDANGNLLSATDPNGNTRSRTYTASGLVLSSTDSLGAQNTFTYDGNGFRLSAELSDGAASIRREEYTYDGNGNQLTRTAFRDVGGVLTPLTEQHEYDDRGRITRITDAMGNVTQKTYNALGLLESETDPLGNTTQFEYDAVGSLVRKTYPDGTIEQFEYDAVGNKVSHTDQAGRVTRMEYDELKRLIRKIYPDGAIETFVWTAGGRLAATIDRVGNRTEFEYDAAGRRTRSTLPEVFDSDSGADTNPVIVDEYDVLGRKTARVGANGGRTSYQYDPAGRPTIITHPNLDTTVYGYDAEGRLVQVTDEEGLATSFGLDAGDRLESVTQPEPTAGAGNPVTTYSYDQAGNRVEGIDAAGRITSMEYDALNRMVSKQLPLGQTASFAYDAVGNLTSHTDYDGDGTSYSYDSMGRVVRKDYADGSSVEYEYTPTGKPTTVTDARGVTSFQYDALDRLTRVTHPTGDRLDYEYDANGNVSSITTANTAVNYQYDALNRLIEVDGPSGITRYEYDLSGNQTFVRFANGVVGQKTYDIRSRLTDIVYTDSSAANIASFSYDLTPTGQRSSVVELDGSEVVYVYDELYRLVSETRTGTNPYSITYSYDVVGNRTGMTVGAATTNYLYDGNDRLTSAGGTTYAYDANGNRTQKVDGPVTTNYTYDFEDRMIEIDESGVVTAFVYDDMGNVVAEIGPGGAVDYLVSDLNPSGFAQILEESSAGSVVATNVFGTGHVSRESAGATRYMLADGQNSVRLLTDGAAVVTDDYLFDAYGRLQATTGSFSNPYQYVGERYVDAADLYYLRARYLDADVGRFITRDPFEGATRDPMTLNPYLYAHANPVNMLDPSGRFTLLGVSISIPINATIRSVALEGIFGVLNIRIAKTLGEKILAPAQRLLEEVLFANIDYLGLPEDFLWTNFKVARYAQAVGYGSLSFTLAIPDAGLFQIFLTEPPLRALAKAANKLRNDLAGFNLNPPATALDAALEKAHFEWSNFCAFVGASPDDPLCHD